MTRLFLCSIAVLAGVLCGCGSADLSGSATSEHGLKQKLLGVWKTDSGATLHFQADGNVISDVPYLGGPKSTYAYTLASPDQIKFGKSTAKLTNGELHASLVVELGGDSGTVNMDDVYRRVPGGTKPAAEDQTDPSLDTAAEK